MDRNCTCKDWEENWDSIKDIFIYSHIHGYKYDGKEFEYCPWCSKELYDKDMEDKCNNCDPIENPLCDKCLGA